jgi:hypothetical protein
MKQLLYVLVVDKAWAKLYKAGFPPLQLTLVYHHALFGGWSIAEQGEDELASNLCRILRADRQSGKFRQLVMLASDDMLAALHRQYDGDWNEVTVGGLKDLPPHYTDADLGVCVARLIRQRQEAQEGRPDTTSNAEIAGKA